MDPLAAGGTAGVTAIVLAAFKAIENANRKKNGGGIETKVALLSQRVEQLERQCEETNQKQKEMLRVLYEFREKVLLHMARSEKGD